LTKIQPGFADFRREWLSKLETRCSVLPIMCRALRHFLNVNSCVPLARYPRRLLCAHHRVTGSADNFLLGDAMFDAIHRSTLSASFLESYVSFYFQSSLMLSP